MAKKDKTDKSEEWFAAVSELAVEKVAEPVAEVPAMMSFDRYFASLGRPAHHKRGMVAFVKSIKGRKTKAEWDKLFQGY